MQNELEIQTEQPIEKRFQCRHIHTAGNRCGSPSLRRENFCFYHHSTRVPVPKVGVEPAYEPFLLPVLEDRAAIQLAISQVIARIASNDVDIKRGRLLLFGLQIAIRALPREASEPRRDRNGRYEEDPIDLNQIELDPELGLLAPIAEHIQPEAQKGFAQRLLEELQSRRKPAEPKPEEEQNEQSEPAPETEPQSETEPEPETIPTIQAVADRLHSHPTKLHAENQSCRSSVGLIGIPQDGSKNKQRRNTGVLRCAQNDKL